MRSGLNVLGGDADGHAVLDHSLALRDGAAGDFVAEGDGVGKRQAVLRVAVIDLEIEQCGDVVVGVDGEADTAHGVDGV